MYSGLVDQSVYDVGMATEPNDWVVIKQDERGRIAPGISGDAKFALASLDPDQMKAIDAVLHAAILTLSANIGATVGYGAVSGELAEKVVQRDGVAYARKKLKEAHESAARKRKEEGL